MINATIPFKRGDIIYDNSRTSDLYLYTMVVNLIQFESNVALLHFYHMPNIGTTTSSGWWFKHRNYTLYSGAMQPANPQ